MRKTRSRYVSVTALAVGIGLVVGTLTGCGPQTISAVLPSVNNTFVDVDGLRQALGKVVLSYTTEDFSEGANSLPVFMNGAMYTFARTQDGKTRMTKWHLATGEKGWSAIMNPDPWPDSLSWQMMPDPWPKDSLTSASENLFFVGNSVTAHDSIAALDNSTGMLRWSQRLQAMSRENDASLLSAPLPLTVTGPSLYASQVCAIVLASPPSVPASRANPSGIWIWQSTGMLAARIAYPTLTTPIYTASIPLLYDGATIYAALPVSTPHDKSIITTKSRTTYTDLVVISAKTRKVRYLRSFRGLVNQLIKQDDHLVLLRAKGDSIMPPVIDVLTLGTRPWQHVIASASLDDGTPWTSIAVDAARVYAATTTGMLTTFSLASLEKLWTLPFAPYKTTIMDGPDFGKLFDYHPEMTLTVATDILYVQDGGGLVVGVDPSTGNRLWEKRVSQVVWHQTYAENRFLVQPVNKGLRVIMFDGTVSVWQ